MRRTAAVSTRKVVGIGFLPEKARHGFLIDVPKGNGKRPERRKKLRRYVKEQGKRHAKRLGI